MILNLCNRTNLDFCKFQRLKVWRKYDFWSRFQLQKCLSLKITRNPWNTKGAKWVEKEFTVWKFHGFSITQILCEINFGNFSAKFAILTHSEGLKFYFYEILHFPKSEIYQEPLNWQKWQFLNFFILQNWFHVKSEW